VLRAREIVDDDSREHLEDEEVEHDLHADAEEARERVVVVLHRLVLAHGIDGEVHVHWHDVTTHERVQGDTRTHRNVACRRRRVVVAST
jgi:hypothetical protein